MLIDPAILTAPPLRGGDILLFSGSGFPSGAIKFFTRSKFTHAAAFLDPSIPVNGKPQTEPMLIESTRGPLFHSGRSGPQINPYRPSAYDPKGCVWQLYLSDRIRAFIDWKVLWDVASRKLNGDTYDTLELADYVLRDLPFINYIPQVHKARKNQEVCSEFIAELLQAGGLPALDPPQIPPNKLGTFRIYSHYVQVFGPPTPISNFNTV